MSYHCHSCLGKTPAQSRLGRASALPHDERPLVQRGRNYGRTRWVGFNGLKHLEFGERDTKAKLKKLVAAVQAAAENAKIRTRLTLMRLQRSSTRLPCQLKTERHGLLVRRLMQTPCGRHLPQLMSNSQKQDLLRGAKFRLPTGQSLAEVLPAPCRGLAKVFQQTHYLHNQVYINALTTIN